MASGVASVRRAPRLRHEGKESGSVKFSPKSSQTLVGNYLSRAFDLARSESAVPGQEPRLHLTWVACAKCRLTHARSCDLHGICILTDQLKSRWQARWRRAKPSPVGEEFVQRATILIAFLRSAEGAPWTGAWMPPKPTGKDVGATVSGLCQGRVYVPPVWVL